MKKELENFLKKFDLSNSDFIKIAVKAKPGFSEGFGNIGFVELQKGNIDEAIKNLEKATAFNFRYTQAFTNLGNAYLRAGRLGRAIAAYRRAPSEVRVRFDEAVSWFESELLELGPDRITELDPEYRNALFLELEQALELDLGLFYRDGEPSSAATLRRLSPP